MTYTLCALHKSITNVSILLVGHADIHVDIHTSFIPMCPFQNNYGKLADVCVCEMWFWSTTMS